MMAIDQLDDMEQFEAERAQARERSTTAPFFLHLRDGERATVRLLLNFNKHPRMDFHSRYNKDISKYDANNVCGKALEQPCALCEQAKKENDPKLKAKRFAYLPVYVHHIKKQQTDKSWVPVTFKENGEDRPVCGIRMLDMKLAFSPIMDNLADAYLEDADNPAERDITRYDFVITRRGAGLDSSYTVTAKSGAPLPLPDGLPTYTTDSVKAEVIAHCPVKLVGGADDADAGDDDDRDF